MATGSHLSIITLNVNGLNVQTKRQRLAEWVQKEDTYICYLQRQFSSVAQSCLTLCDPMNRSTPDLPVDPPKNKGHIQTESEGLEKDISCKWKTKQTNRQTKAGVAIFISDKINFEIKAVKRDKEGHYIMIKGSTQE